jgi:hypothetical protein
MGRDRRESFVRLAEARTTRALHDLQLISNLANRNNYDYTQEDVTAILKALELAVRGVRESFAKADRAEKPRFKLND